MGRYHLEDRLKNSVDIVRTYNWELIIPDIGSVSESVKDADELVTRVRSTSIPGRSVEVIESDWMGMKQFFPGRVNFTHTLQVTFEELENQIVSNVLYEWSNKIFDVRTGSPTGGSSQVSKKRDIAKDIIIRQVAYDGSFLNKSYRLVNCFISNYEDVNLDYTQNDKIMIPVTFSYDYWEFIRS